MHVKELKIHNFRGIKDLHLVFNMERNVVVLVGINGVGKSSILDCINFLVKYYAIIREAYLFDGESIVHRPARLARLIPDFNEILSLSDIHNGENYTDSNVVIDCGDNTTEWRLIKFKDDNDYRSWEAVHDKLKEKIVRQHNLISIGNYFYYLSNRRVIDYAELISELNDFPPSAYLHEKIEIDEVINFKDFSKWFKETEDLENEQRLSDDNQYRHPQLEAVRQTVYSLLGKGYTNLTFKRAIDKMTIKKLNREIAIELLSDGEKNLLAMVSDLSRKLAENNKNLENPLEASALVLIDEIELHLHPAWQRMIIPRLTETFPNCQFIVTTHSPQVLSHVDPECIHILDYDGDNVVVKRPDSSYGLDSNRILEDILGVSKRPQEVQDRMSELFRTINNNDLESAKEIVKELGDKIGIAEPELVKAEATIKRRKIIGR
ncbi:AAA family ATPase [Chamaesiphon sp. VAR_48_metabat_403]|uniref:AAA family ATPase n=1 Tax=Chamaesiphon sp. VAR_48_metabat_403 TaxID=2964700 RepID=UPI00286E318C|nr:AAA family ATPase [Chamaesiphon sp. VAR_48_metabat_403]